MKAWCRWSNTATVTLTPSSSTKISIFCWGRKSQTSSLDCSCLFTAVFITFPTQLVRLTGLKEKILQSCSPSFSFSSLDCTCVSVCGFNTFGCWFPGCHDVYISLYYTLSVFTLPSHLSAQIETPRSTKMSFLRAVAEKQNPFPITYRRRKECAL